MPEDRHGMPGFPRVLRGVGLAYRDRKDRILKDAEAVLHALQQEDGVPGASGKLTVDILDQAESSLLSDFDRHHGGFGGAPKFPPAMALDFLMRCYVQRHTCAGTTPASNRSTVPPTSLHNWCLPRPENNSPPPRAGDFR